MSTFPGSPRLIKGGIVVLDPQNGSVLRVLPLQYFPDTVTRSLQIKGVGGEAGDRIEALRLKGPPVETYKIEAEIDATDQLEVADSQAPLTVFVFGPKRIVPVRITEFSVTEEAFDTSLNPIRAKVSLGMRVLTIDDVLFSEKSGSLFMAYLKGKEQLASQSKPGLIGALGITGIP